MFTPDLYVDLNWINILGSRLELFGRSGSGRHTFACRCPICGDSKKSKKKTRFFIYKKKQNMNVFCHNCGYSSSFYNFVAEVFPQDFSEYKKEQMLTRFNPSKTGSKRVSNDPTPTHQPQPKTCQTLTEKFLATCTPILSLDPNHKARKFLDKRCLGELEQSRLLWSDNFKLTVDSISPEPVSEKFPTEGRIVIPFYSEEEQIEMIQGRTLDPKSSLRYISIKTSDDVDKIYGKNMIDPTKTIYCVEGPFDSLFVDNCIATCDSNLLRAKADVYIWDCEPRNPEIVELIGKAIDLGKSVVIWPSSPDQKMDINDYIKLGMTRNDINQIIKMSTMSGLKARLEFNKWKKV